MFDIVFKNATVIDGSGAPEYQASVYIEKGLIAKISRDSTPLPTHSEIDATGCILSPGFIDVHTHDDVALIVDPDMHAKVSQGVTTVITGHCGYSPAPITRQAKIPDEYGILIPNESYRYERFKDYLEAVAVAKPAVNYLTLVGHSSLRISTMSRLDRAAKPQEMAAMKSLLDECFSAGAVGLSSGLAYSMAEHASTTELIELCQHIHNHRGLYVTHLRSEGDYLIESVDEALQIGREAEVPVIFSHHKAVGPTNYGKTTHSLARIDAARSEQEVALDAYPYAFSSTALTLERALRGGKVVIARSKTRPEMAGRTLDDIASELQLSLAETVAALQPAGALYYSMCEEDVRNVLTHECCMIGSDGLPFDARPHPRLWGSFPRFLSNYVRDENLLSLPEAIRKMTGLPADVYGIKQRGYIRKGYYADLVLFNFNCVQDKATATETREISEGIQYVLVNGEMAKQGSGKKLSTGDRKILKLSAKPTERSYTYYV